MLCKDCTHRRPRDGWCKIKEEHVPRKVNKENKVTSCERWSSKKGGK